MTEQESGASSEAAQQDQPAREDPAAEPAPAPSQKQPRRRRFSLEVAGEGMLLLVATFLFIAFPVQAYIGGWDLDATLMPMIVSALGLPFVLIRLAALIGRTASAAARPKQQIMDTGFKSGDEGEAAVVQRRWIRVVGFIAVMYFGIWLVGFHLAVPITLAVYVRVWGGISRTASLIAGLLISAWSSGSTTACSGRSSPRRWCPTSSTSNGGFP